MAGYSLEPRAIATRSEDLLPTALLGSRQDVLDLPCPNNDNPAFVGDDQGCAQIALRPQLLNG
jgi:hypothetical protein